jgi:hypothetical protein
MTLPLPNHMHERVLDLAADLVNASAQDDTRAKWRLYGELRDFCEREAESGGDHPFLWESLADFTSDDRIAIGFYLRALALAEQLGALEYCASIRLALARRHVSVGEIPVACEHALKADRLARDLDDLDMRRDISQFLLDHLTETA